MPARQGTMQGDRRAVTKTAAKSKRSGINPVQLVASACLAIALLALSGVATLSVFETSAAANTSTQDARLLGCTTAQGFHLGRPMPSDTFDVWLTEWNLSQAVPPTAQPALPRAS